jgi:hypothetical protein
MITAAKNPAVIVAKLNLYHVFLKNKALAVVVPKTSVSISPVFVSN